MYYVCNIHFDTNILRNIRPLHFFFAVCHIKCASSSLSTPLFLGQKATPTHHPTWSNSPVLAYNLNYNCNAIKCCPHMSMFCLASSMSFLISGVMLKCSFCGMGKDSVSFLFPQTRGKNDPWE